MKAGAKLNEEVVRNLTKQKCLEMHRWKAKIKKLIMNNEDKAEVIGVLSNSGRQLECCS